MKAAIGARMRNLERHAKLASRELISTADNYWPFQIGSRYASLSRSRATLASFASTISCRDRMDSRFRLQALGVPVVDLGAGGAADADVGTRPVVALDESQYA